MQKHLVYWVLELGHLYYFYAYGLAGFGVLALVHCAAVSLADVRVHCVGVVLYRFYHG